MTKHEFLEKLINKKDTWQVSMPIFLEQNETITINKGINYRGAFRIAIDGDVLFECLIESLKGIVQPINEFISMKLPVVEYVIDVNDLKTDYIYEDQLSLYYLGGTTSVKIKFIIVENEVEVKEEIVQENNSLRKKGKSKEEITVALSKHTYTMDEIIRLNINNDTNKAKHIVLECGDDYVSPNLCEVYLNDKWTQEFYLKKTMVERLFGNLAFSSEPFKEINIKGFIDHESLPSFHVKAFITAYEPYETHRIITSELMFQRTKISVFRHYIEGLVNASSRREASNLIDLIKACLNYNQKDLDLRLFHIWLLLEYGHKKEAKIQMSIIEKYEDYYSSCKEFPTIKILESIIHKDVSSAKDIFEGIDERSTWLELLAKARHTASRNSRYNYYKSLYISGVRKSFLFAEVTSLLNQLPIIPDIDDELYITSLKWAFNKKGVTTSWLNKLERHYYQLEKNPYMTSSLGLELYKLKPSKNFLRLFAQLCINEERYDKVAFDAYKEALEKKIYIQDLENHYIYASWQAKGDIDLDLLKHFTKIKHLDIPIREYIYLSVVRKRATYGLLFRRLYNEIIEYLKENSMFSQEIIILISLLFEEFIKEKNQIFFHLIIISNIKTMYKTEEGQALMMKIMEFCMSEFCWVEKTKKVSVVRNIVSITGFEGLIRIYEDKSKVIKYFDQLNVDNKYNGSFLSNRDYIYRYNKQEPLCDLYKSMVIDDFLEDIISQYFHLNIQEQELIKATIIYYISRRIVVGFNQVSDQFIEVMYNYYISLEDKESWLLLALSSGLNTTNKDLITRIRILYEEGQKHDIIIPWLNEDTFEQNSRVIHYLSHPTDQVIISYRFAENEDFINVPMDHIAFGVFTHRIVLFYGEIYEYYIVIKESSGYTHIPHSDIISNDFISQNSLLIENEYSVEARIDNISLSYELNDDLSAKAFIDEQLEFNRRIKRLLRV